MEQINTPTLSKETTDILKETRKGPYPSVFYQQIYALRKAGWPLRAIANSLGVSRTAVSSWETKADPQNTTEALESLPAGLTPNLKSTYLNKDLTWEESAHLHTLAVKASKVRRYTSENSEGRKAAKALEKLLLEYNDEGISITKLAQACGVTRRAIAQRMEKYR